MKIVVLVKHVPDATGDRGFAADHTVDRDSVDGLLCELDEYAVEQALQVSETIGDCEVVALTMGPDSAAAAVKRALQMGANSGIQVLDDAIAGSDALATSRILAAAIRRAEADLVLCGMASTDGEMGVIPVMIAERLGWPAATLGSSLEVADGEVTVRRDTDTASLTIAAKLPAVVSVTDQSGEARYPSMRGILAAKRKPVVSWSLADLGIAAETVGLGGSGSRVNSASPRPPRGAGQKISDADGSGADALVSFLVERKFI